MKFQNGWQFPDDETHLPEMIHRQSLDCGIPGYQVRSRNKSLFNLEGLRHRHAIDIGANVGLWARDLCTQFQQVTAFEPIQDFRHCLMENVKAANLHIEPVALGNRMGTTEMIRIAGNAGHTHVDAKSQSGHTEIRTLDSYDFDNVDYIKIDCEGYEYEVAEGAKQTILRCKPRICCEQKPHKIFGAQYRARDLLLSWGMIQLPHWGDDLVFDWPKK
jgi:FkbM family methyltransferase